MRLMILSSEFPPGPGGIGTHAYLWFRKKAKEILNRTIKNSILLFNRGDSVTCLLCGWKGRFFLKQTCPQCNSLPRHRLIPYGLKYFNVDLDQKIVLHIGPNKPETDWILSQNLTLHIRLDLFQNSFVNLISDVTKLSLLESSIDIVISWHCLEHIPMDRQAIREIYRVLKKGGQAILSVPIYPPGRPKTYEDPSIPRRKYLEIFGHPDHVRACGLDYSKRFEEVGFSVSSLRIDELASSTSEEMVRYGLSKSHVVWLCKKN